MISVAERLIAPRSNKVWIGFDVVEYLAPFVRQGDGSGAAAAIRLGAKIRVHMPKVCVFTCPPGNRLEATALRIRDSNPGHHEFTVFHGRAAYCCEQVLASPHVHNRLVGLAQENIEPV